MLYLKIRAYSIDRVSLVLSFRTVCSVDRLTAQRIRERQSLRRICSFGPQAAMEDMRTWQEAEERGSQAGWLVTADQVFACLLKPKSGQSA